MEALLLDDSDFQYSAGLVTSHAVESRLADRVEACFTSGEGIPFADYGQEMVETIHSFSKAAYELFLPSVLLPELPDLTQRLDIPRRYDELRTTGRQRPGERVNPFLGPDTKRHLRLSPDRGLGLV